MSSHPLRPSLFPKHLRRPADALAWAAETYGESLVVVTSLGPQTLAALDILHTLGHQTDVVLIDTGLLFAETHALRRAVELRYGIKIRRVQPTVTLAEQSRTEGPELWNKAPDRCCRIRKVEPLRRALRGHGAWISGLRRDGGASRALTETVEWDETNGLVKVNPFAWWTRDQVFEYLRRNEVPYNALLDDGFASVGCWPCTRRSELEGSERAGRWAGFNKTECGLHLPASMEMSS